MKKPIALLLLILIGPVLGAGYGILHDQITYSLSHEYYTKLKFVQFGFADWGLGQNIGTVEQPEILMQHPRFGASIVGVLATWWVGLIVGIVLGWLGLMHRTGRVMFQVTMRACL